MIKEYLWNMLSEQTKCGYCNFKLHQRKDYKCLKSRKRKKKHVCLLLDTPTHGNLGDQAIIVAERAFIEKTKTYDRVLEFTFGECSYSINEIKKNTSEDDIIFLPGGGFIGSLWLNEQNNINHILSAFNDNKIIIFPQTIFFDESKGSITVKSEFVQKIRKCRDITIFIRDKNSYQWMQKQKFNKNVKFFLVPDIVTTLQLSNAYIRQRKVLFCLRKDKERSNNIFTWKAEVENFVNEQGYESCYIDTVLKKSINKTFREKEVYKKLHEFQTASLVITDRLHGMIFSVITETPCIALDNLSKKVSGGYRWFKELPYIKLVENRPVSIEDIQDMLSVQDTYYDIHKYDEYYELMRKVIRGEM